MDGDVRLVRSFVVVAQEGNLTRAAERLFVSQPGLTKQIQQLEDRLGVRLFVRSRAGMALTAAGRALAERAPRVVAGWDAAMQETRRAFRGAARVLRVGFVGAAANEATPRIVAEFARRRPDWRIDMARTDWSDATAGLADGDVDAAIVHLPVSHARHVEVLFAEPRCAVLPAGHALAARDRLTFAELVDEPVVAGPPEAGDARSHWLALEERGGREPVIGAVARNVDEWLTAIANGYGIALAPEGVARFYSRPGVTFRPVSGVSASQVAVAWERDRDPVVSDFVASCRSVVDAT